MAEPGRRLMVIGLALLTLGVGSAAAADSMPPPWEVWRDLASLAVLEQAGVAEIDLLAAVTNVDEVNLVACMSAGAFNIKTKVARVSNPDYFRDTSRHRGAQRGMVTQRRVRDLAVSLNAGLRGAEIGPVVGGLNRDAHDGQA